jgi:integrase
MAHVEKREHERRKDGSRGTATYRVRYRDRSGKEHSRSFKTRARADSFKKQVENELVTGEWHDPAKGKKLFKVWVHEYNAQANKRPTTAARDATVLKKHFSALDDRPLNTITPADIQRLVRTMATRLKPSTVRTNYGVIRAVFNAAVDAELIGRSPCRGVRGIKTPNATRKQRRCLDVDEIIRLASAMPVEYRPMVYLGGVLGLRWSEVAGLKVGNIDFLRNKLTIDETVAEVDGRLQSADVKTDASRRTISLPPFVKEMLSEHLALTGRSTPDAYVFQAPAGGPVRYRNFRMRVFKRAVTAARLDGVTFHSLRHSAGGLMRQVNVHTQVIQQRLGHSSSRTTTDIYGWVPDETDRAAADALDGMFSVTRGHFASSVTPETDSA